MDAIMGVIRNMIIPSRHNDTMIVLSTISDAYKVCFGNNGLWNKIFRVLFCSKTMTENIHTFFFCNIIESRETSSVSTVKCNIHNSFRKLVVYEKKYPGMVKINLFNDLRCFSLCLSVIIYSISMYMGWRYIKSMHVF